MAVPNVVPIDASEAPLAEGDHIHFGFLWAIALSAAMGGFLFGYDMVVISGAKPFFEAYFALTSEAARGWAISCALIGCLGGALLCGLLSVRSGRRTLLIFASILFALSSVLTGRAESYASFILWRMLGGVAIGIASSISPLYIAEVTPAYLRGRMVAINQLTIVLGVLGSQLVNLLIAEPVGADASLAAIAASWNGQQGWRWMFVAVAVPSLLFLLGAICVPESPRWLVQAGQSERARRVLQRLGSQAYAERELESIRQSLVADARQRSAWREVFAPGARKALLVGVVLAALQPWCGINVILSYADEVFGQVGFGVDLILVNILLTGLTLFVFTLVAMFTVDRLGRRALMLVGCAAIGLFHVLIGASYYLALPGPILVAMVLGAIASYAFSLAPITWVLISEIYPNRTRSQSVAVAVSAMWGANFALLYTYPFLRAGFGMAGTFWLYAGICAAGFLFIRRNVVETKGKSLEEMERLFERT